MSYLINRPYWYLRHGQTDWNAQHLSQGRTDVPLNITGKAQAVAAGNALASHWVTMQTPITRIVSSPLGRARKTADTVQAIIQHQLGITIPMELDDGLKEVCFGVEERQPMGPWYEEWVMGRFTPNGGEPFHELCERVSFAVNRAIQNTQGGHVLIVAHGGIFRSLRYLMGLKPNVRLANAQPLCVTPPVQGNKVWSLNPVSLDS